MWWCEGGGATQAVAYERRGWFMICQGVGWGWGWAGSLHARCTAAALPSAKHVSKRSPTAGSGGHPKGRSRSLSLPPRLFRRLFRRLLLQRLCVALLALCGRQPVGGLLVLGGEVLLRALLRAHAVDLALVAAGLSWGRGGREGRLLSGGCRQSQGGRQQCSAVLACSKRVLEKSNSERRIERICVLCRGHLCARAATGAAGGRSYVAANGGG